MSTTLEIGRIPAADSRSCSHSGEGPTFTSLKTRAVKRGQRSGTSTVTLAKSSALPSPVAAASSAQGSAESGAPVTAWTSRATPKTPKQSLRFGVTSISSTGSASGITSPSGVPTASASSSTMMPSCSSPISISSAARIIPSEATPRSFALRSFSPPGIRAPGSATATVWPVPTLGAPQTIVRGPSSPTSTVQTRSRSASGCWTASVTLPTTKLSGLGGPTTSIRSTSVPVITSRSASSSAGTPGSQYSRSQVYGTFISDHPSGELLQHPHVVVEEAPQVGDAVPQHRHPLDPQAVGEAGDHLRVITKLLDKAEHVRVDHPGAEDLDPALPLAEVAALAVREHAGALALEAGDVDLDARLGEGEVVGPQPHLAGVAEERPRHRQQRPLQVGQGQPLGHRQPLHLVEHRAVGGVGVAPVDLARDDDEDRWALRLHRPDLHRRGVGAQQHVGVRLDVEGVLEHPRRVVRRVVQGGEVVVVVLDLRAFGDFVAEPDHDVLDQPRGAGDQVLVAERPRRRAGQGDVDPVGDQFGVELGRVEALGAPGDQRLELLAGLVGGAADGAPLLRRQLRDPAQNLGQLGFAAEELDPQILQLGARGRGGDRLGAGDPELLDLLKHWAAPSTLRATISAHRPERRAARRRSPPRRPR